MSIIVTVNGNKFETCFLIAPDQGRTFPVQLGLRTDDDSTVNTTLKLLPGGATVELEKSEVAVGPVETFVSIHATSVSNSRNDTVLQVLVGDVVQSSCALTAITKLKVWFKGRFEARFATDGDVYNEPRGKFGWTFALPGEDSFVKTDPNNPTKAHPDSIADRLDKPVGREIRFHNPVALRSHVPPIGVTIASITGKLATGTDEEFAIGDPVIDQPVNLGAHSYFAGNRPQPPKTPRPPDSHSAAAEPIALFEFHIGSWLSGKSLNKEDRPITEVTILPDGRDIGKIYSLTPQERSQFGILAFPDFNEKRKAELQADLNAMPENEQQNTQEGTNLTWRIGNLENLTASYRSLLAQGFPEEQCTTPGYIQREWFRGLINDAIQIDDSQSAVLAYLKGGASFRFSANFFNFHSDELCGQVYGYIAPAADDLVDPNAHIIASLPAVPAFATPEPDQAIPVSRTVLPLPESMDPEYAQRHCLMVSEEGGEGAASSATIWYLDWLDPLGVPHSVDLASQYEGFKRLGADGWKLVQVIEKLPSVGMDGPIPARTHFYFTRPVRGKG